MITSKLDVKTVEFLTSFISVESQKNKGENRNSRSVRAKHAAFGR